MEESFHLLSSMSPKCNSGKTTRRLKGPSKLALKKSLRRSSVYNKHPIIEKPVILIEDDSSSDSKYSDEIVLLDDRDKKSDALQLLSDTKVESIKKWISNIPKENLNETSDLNNVSMFSQLSSIHGDFRNSSIERPINSTFLNNDTQICKQFDELFKKKLPESKVGSKKVISPESEEIIDDSDNESSFKTAIQDSDNESSNKENNPKNYNIVFTTPKPASVFDECESVLDEVYGDMWRRDKERILPQSEPRPIKPTNLFRNALPNTEIKPKKMYVNPYSENAQQQSRTLLQKLTEARVKSTFQNSPWRQNLDRLCDSDTDSSKSHKKLPPKTKLVFDEDKQPKRTPKVNKKKKDNDKGSSSDSFSNFSDSGLTLEEKLKGKSVKPKETIKCKTPARKDKAKPQAHITSSSSKASTDSSNNSSSEVTKKKAISKNTLRLRKVSISSDSSDSWNDFSTSGSDEIKSKTKASLQPKLKTSEVGTASFLASLSKNVPDSRCDPSARIFRNNYKTYKDELVKKLFKLYNEKIFGGAIDEDSPIEWSDRMTGTAGYCVCRKITHRNRMIQRAVKFKLSSKILDSADRLRDTFVHELCHAATWILNEVSDGHGPFWKSWACKAMQTFPELRPIKRCHDYAIHTKYTYKCVGCGYSFGRHSKSLDLERKRCGRCYGKFEVLLNKTTKNGETKAVPSVKKPPTAFALFVKENYSKYKSDDMKNKDVMKLLGQKFKDMKVDQKSN